MNDLVSQTTAFPTRKVTAGGLAGAAAAVLCWILGEFGVDVPAGIEAAFTVLISFGAGYLTKDRA